MRINAEEADEIQISASNTGVWKSEKMPMDPKKLLPPSPTAVREAPKKKATKSAKRRKR